MRCLWLTCLDPERERRSQNAYSWRLMHAIAEAGAAVEVLCIAHDRLRRSNGALQDGVRWWLAPGGPRRWWSNVLSDLPVGASRSATAAMRQALERLAERHWDSVVFDGLAAGWSLAPLLSLNAGRRPRLVYVTHEQDVPGGVEAPARGHNPVRQALLRHDARKAARLEQRLLEAADLVTAQTPNAARRYRERDGVKPILLLPPGYRGRRVPARRITASLPRRAVVIGRFDRAERRADLQRFLGIADPLFAAAGAELQVVGSGKEVCMRGLRHRLATTTFTGPVDSLFPYMDEARIAIVPERSGRGFEAHVLDYVFNRLPVAALEESLEAVPPMPTGSILTYSRSEELALGVLNTIDDLDLLNRLQETAYADCADLYDWQSRGRALLSAMAVTE